MAGCCGDPDDYKRKATIAAVIGFVAMGVFMAATWVNAHPEIFRKHRDFTAPQEDESHPMPRVAVDRS